MRELLEEILPEKTELQDYVVEDNFPNVGHRKMILNTRQIYQKGEETSMILMTLKDFADQ
jgi:two-component system, chemotaxis family, CheB/CheR fusion protein